jgi:hypothetical protein
LTNAFQKEKCLQQNIPFYFLEAEFQFISLGELIIEI